MTSADRRIVVGPAGAVTGVDVVCREEPAGGGPLAAIAAGLAYVHARLVAVLAGDLPFLTASTVDRLLAATGPDVDVAMLVDDAGRDQLLLAVWRTDALQTRLATIGDPNGQPVRRLFDTAAIVRVPVMTKDGQPPPWLDCDTEDDLRRAREWT